MGLHISQTPARIGIDRTPFVMEIETRNARLDLHQKHAKVNIETELPKIQIDQYEAFASAGLKNNYDLSRDLAQRTYQHIMQTIANFAEEGNMLAAIEKGGNPIAEIAKRNAFTVNEFGYDYIPKTGPKFSLKEGKVKIDPERNSEGIHNGVEAQYTPGEVNFRYTPAQINMYMKQYASIKFSYDQSTFNAYK